MSDFVLSPCIGVVFFAWLLAPQVDIVGNQAMSAVSKRHLPAASAPTNRSAARHPSNSPRMPTWPPRDTGSIHLELSTEQNFREFSFQSVHDFVL